MDRLGIEDYSEESVKNDLFSEGLSLEKDNKLLVEFGIIKKKMASYFDVDAETLYADFKWDTVLEKISTDNIQLKSIPKFPFVKRDFALLLDESVTFDELKKVALKTERNLLKNINLFDVYTGKKLPKGKKSYAISFMLQDERKTLTGKKMENKMKKLQRSFENDFGATLR